MDGYYGGVGTREIRRLKFSQNNWEKFTTRWGREQRKYTKKKTNETKKLFSCLCLSLSFLFFSWFLQTRKEQYLRINKPFGIAT